MDVSKLCISVGDGDQSSSSSERISLPPMAEIHNDNHNVHNNNNNIIIYPKNSSLEYQQRYQLQHQHLKHYSFSNSSQSTTTPPSLPSIQQQNEYFYHSTSNSPNLPLPNIEPTGMTSLPSMSTPTTTEEVNPKSAMISQLLEQCNTIYTRIGKYRVDPLTESERSNIIDQVYFTAEKMLQSIQQLQSDESQLFTPPSDNDDNADKPTTSSQSVFTSINPDINNQVEDMDEYKMIRQARNLQDSNTRPKYRRRSKRSMIGQRCHSCNTTETPEWRRGPDGARTLCNACGLHYSKLLRKGSMTVQTHNYMIEGAPDYKKAPRIIQYPIIQVNSNNGSSSSNTTTTQEQPPYIRDHSHSSGSFSRITEIHDDEEMTDNKSKYNNKMEDVG